MDFQTMEVCNFFFLILKLFLYLIKPHTSCPEDRDSQFLRNVENHLPNYKYLLSEHRILRMLVHC